VALPGLAELPRPADGVPGEDRASVGGGDHERELAAHLAPHGPQRAPVAVHGHPRGVGALDLDGLHGARAGDVVDEDHEEPGVPADGEPDSAALPARDSSVVDGRDAAFAPGEGGVGRVRQVEVVLGRVAPAAPGPGWAEVGGGDGDGPRVAPAPVLRRLGLADADAFELETRPARRSAAVKPSAERCRHGAVAERVCVLVPARASRRLAPAVGRAVERDVRVPPSPRRSQHRTRQHQHHHDHCHGHHSRSRPHPHG
jgi:hypothetical protein